MPVRLTDTIDRNLQMYRHRCGAIYGWTLDPECIAIPCKNDELLDRMPLVVYVQFPNATWKISDLPVGVYSLIPKIECGTHDTRQQAYCTQPSHS